MEEKQEQKFQQMTETPAGRLICHLALPCIISMLVTAFYNMADTFFVGMLQSNSATAAVGVVFSLMAVLQAIGFFFGHGSGNFISRELGRHHYEEASNMAATGFFSALFSGLVLCILGQIFLEPLAYLLGSTDTILPYSTAYLRVILLGAPWMTASLVLELTLDSTPLSQELEAYMQALCRYTDKLTLRTDGTAQDAPCVRVCRADSTWTGLAFHGVPGGHEFTSFVLGLYNAAGPGQALDEATMAAIQAIQQPTDLQILVSLSCTMCPELVTAAQRLAAANPHITAQAYDLNHFPALRDQYKVMSVPCLVVNHGQQVSFGKKSIAQLLDLLS